MKIILLIQRYIDDDNAENIANRLGLNLRTYFRKIIHAENSFSILMLREGFIEIIDYFHADTVARLPVISVTDVTDEPSHVFKEV